jgi:hypothetical protein
MLKAKAETRREGAAFGRNSDFAKENAGKTMKKE